jgi:hypothetical protein
MTDFDDPEAWARNMRGSFLAAETDDQRLAVLDRVLRNFVSADKEASELRKHFEAGAVMVTVNLGEEERQAFLARWDKRMGETE